MSLKVFHVIFIVLATLMAIGCAVWALRERTAPEFGIACIVAAIGLVIYGMYFVRKSRRIIT